MVAEGEAVWAELVKRIERANAIFDQISDIEKGDIGRINKGLEQLRLETSAGWKLSGANKAAELAEYEQQAAQDRAELDAQYAGLQQQLDALNADAKRDSLLLLSAEGKEMKISLGNIVHAHQPNAMSLLDKSVHYGWRRLVVS